VRKPRIKPEHAPYRTAGEKIRIGGGVHGIAAEITDPGGWLWALLVAIDGTSEPAQIIRKVCREHPEAAEPDVRDALDTLIGAGFVEDAAAAAGVHVTAEKLKITVISAMMTAFAGALYCQYQMFISPDTVSGIAVSLQMVFAAVVGGIYVPLGPTIGALITICLTEFLRIWFGTRALGWDNVIYGTALVLFIIFLPQGIMGSILGWRRPLPTRAAAPAE